MIEDIGTEIIIVSGTEECDDGAAGSNLCYGASGASPCTQKGGVQCAFGECCNTNTGTFKAAGSLCRNAMHQCSKCLSPSHGANGPAGPCNGRGPHENKGGKKGGKGKGKGKGKY